VLAPGDARDHLTRTEAFLTDAFAKLEAKPQTVDEVALANQSYHDMRPGTPQQGYGRRDGTLV